VANENSNDISVYAVNATTGALTQVARSPFAAGVNPRAVAID
jgi:6-phosphogluconolactonase (cycloisomerase 2 family)